jgi:hypothetical protein
MESLWIFERMNKRFGFFRLPHEGGTGTCFENLLDRTTEFNVEDVCTGILNNSCGSAMTEGSAPKF